MREQSYDERATVLDDADRHTKPLDGGDNSTIQSTIAIHVVGAIEEIRIFPVARPFQAGVGTFSKGNRSPHTATK